MILDLPMRLDLRRITDKEPAMDSKEVGVKRSSDIMSLINNQTPAPSASAMLPSASLSPGSRYPPGPPPPYTTGWSVPGPHQTSGLISPPSSRRTSDGRAEAPPLQVQPASSQRQSLPSIHEALSNSSNSNSSGLRSGTYTSPIAPSQAYSQNQPVYTHTQHVAPRPFAPTDHPKFSTQNSAPHSQRSSPSQPLHTTPFSRNEHFTDDTRRPPIASLQNAPAPPPNPYAARFDRLEQERRTADLQSNGHGFQAPQQSFGYGPHPPIHGPSLYPHYQQSPEPLEGWKAQKSGPFEFQDHVNRSLDAYDFENCLINIKESSAALLEVSTHYYKIAQEQQRPARDGMPTRQQCMQMLDKQANIYKHLSLMRDLIEREDALAADQRMREAEAKVGAVDYDEEMSMYSDDTKQGSSGNDAKRRKGRAAPPGRCHSCNRAETPEWRRGPDGARTLCNACGLHYAKLTRKTNMKAQNAAGSSLQPKTMDHNSPRPLG